MWVGEQFQKDDISYKHTLLVEEEPTKKLPTIRNASQSLGNLVVRPQNRAVHIYSALPLSPSLFFFLYTQGHRALWYYRLLCSSPGTHTPTQHNLPLRTDRHLRVHNNPTQ